VLFRSPNHWQFNRLGIVAADANRRISSVAEFASLISNQLTENLQPKDFALSTIADDALLAEKLADLRHAIDPNPGTAAHKIVNAIRDDFASVSALVDASTLKEIAWEDQPGREPRTD
jgi:hypothetical protein